MNDERLTADELRDAWLALSSAERLDAFRLLDTESANDFFLGLSSLDQAGLVVAMANGERKLWLRLLAPDDAADLIQRLANGEKQQYLELIDPPTRAEVIALMAYAEDAAGGLMSPRFARLRPEMTAAEAIRYLQRQASEKLETLYYAYVLDPDQRLVGVVSFRELFSAPSDKRVSEVMHADLVSVPDTMDQEAVARLIAKHDLHALPVVDPEGRMKGIVTIDDMIDVAEQEATEDIHKLGGMEALDAPYMQTSMSAMIKKRASWLAVLFVGEMLTASAMGHYEHEIEKAVVLALFVPLIISSGGNSGSQAATLIIRAMALGEVAVRDWWRIIRRELGAGLLLGLILAAIGLARILLWQALFHTYGARYVEVAATVALSLVGVVTWGTIAGSMLPFVIRRAGFDPASASAPFVATMVDVSGLVIYFSVAQVVLRGSLL
ncbi:MAG: magnesium transporter [Deltaproteobacteria bacterium]|nr:magnesium transporter [Deltaproteobacteria bacterium]